MLIFSWAPYELHCVSQLQGPWGRFGVWSYLSFGHRYLSFGHRYLSFGHRYLSFGHRYLLFGHRYLLFGHRYLSFGRSLEEGAAGHWHLALLYASGTPPSQPCVKQHNFDT